MKKKDDGLIIRLIDVVLILLFGFISISQVEQRSKVNLPVSTETRTSKPDTENLIEIAIFPYENDQYGYLLENETLLIKSYEELVSYVSKKQSKYKGKVRVKIYSESKAPIRYAMQIADFCERRNFDKSLVVKSLKSQSGLRHTY
ncbi:biopolymer transporter ExbD [candidate division KSB1 bacterium]|nr:biopolymer transporter ExbD [candidate division KSB1 bacterium]